jgi:hypothetical protein
MKIVTIGSSQSASTLGPTNDDLIFDYFPDAAQYDAGITLWHTGLLKQYRVVEVSAGSKMWVEA